MYDRLLAARERDEGIRKVSRITWRAGLTGVVCSALIGVALTHHAEAGAGHGQQSGRSSFPVSPRSPRRAPAR